MNTSIIQRGIYTAPSLLPLDNPQIISYIGSLFPYDVGVEIESSYLNYTEVEQGFKELVAKGLIKDYRIGTSETSFRLPNNVKGLVGLEQVLNIFLNHYSINLESGIHYHIDFSEIDFSSITISDELKGFTLKELDSWEYKGNYNKRKFERDQKGSWVTTRSYFKTLEFRIGEMSFDYSVIIKRILHLQQICTVIKNNFTDPRIKLEQLHIQLEELRKEKERKQLDIRVVDEVISNRIIKI